MQPIAPEPAAAGGHPAPLNIWSIVTSLTSGGAEILVSNLSPALVARGMINRVIALCDARTVGNTIEMEAKLASRIRNGGGEFVSLGLSRRRGPIEGAAALRRELAAGSPDVIHCHTARAVAMVGLSGFRGPVVLTHHNSRLSFPRFLFRSFDLVVDRYVAISPEIASIYYRNTRRPVEVILNAAACEFSGSNAPRLMPGKPCRVLSVGAISKQKNYGLLLETARILRDEKRDFAMPQFVIAGGGQELDRLRRQVFSMGLNGHVEFLGERSDILELMTSADVLLNTSTYEGLPVAMIEAMAMALPIVATDVPGSRLLVADGANGLLVPLGDPEAMAKSIGRLITEPNLYRSLSLEALERSREFSIEGSTDRHLAVYSKACR